MGIAGNSGVQASGPLVLPGPGQQGVIATNQANGANGTNGTNGANGTYGSYGPYAQSTAQARS